MNRVVWTADLKPNLVNIYIQKHHEIWPSMANVIRESGLNNYSIHVEGTIVIGCYDCEDARKTAEFQVSSAITADWANHMKECFLSPPKSLNNQIMFLA